MGNADAKRVSGCMFKAQIKLNWHPMVHGHAQVGQRLHAVQFRHAFDGRAEALAGNISALAGARLEVRANALLPAVLETAQLGNYLNAGHRACAAAGFTIECHQKDSMPEGWELDLLSWAPDAGQELQSQLQVGAQCQQSPST